MIRALLEDGRTSVAQGQYAEDVVFAAHLPGLTLSATDRRSAAECLALWEPWRGTITSWSATHFENEGPDDGGADVQVEWRRASDGLVLRQGHYLQIDDTGKISRHLVLPQRAKGGSAPRGEAGPVLSELIAAAARREPMHGGYGGGFLERLHASAGPPRIVKYVMPGASWHAQATHDPGREALLFLDGTLSGLPESIGHAIVAVESYGTGWAVIMRDVGGRLPRRPIARDTVRSFLVALQDFHRTTEGVARDYLATTRDRWGIWWPRTCLQQADSEDEQPKLAARGWDLVDSVLPTDVADIVKWIPEHDAEWLAGMEVEGTSILHGDAHFANLAMEDGTYTMLDWGLATQGTPATEAAWLANFIHHYDFSLTELLQDVRDVWGMKGDLNLDRALLALASGVLPTSLVGAYDYPDPAHRREMKAKVAGWIQIVRASM